MPDYLNPIYLFKNSNHIFDNEVNIARQLDEYELKDGDKVIKPYSFVDSTGNKFIQVSDIFVGLIGKFSKFINTSSIEEIENQMNNLSNLQKENLDLLLDLLDKSIERNVGFINSVDSLEEIKKSGFIRYLRNK